MTKYTAKDFALDCLEEIRDAGNAAILALAAVGCLFIGGAVLACFGL